jgi:hypothetical protein
LEFTGVANFHIPGNQRGAHPTRHLSLLRNLVAYNATFTAFQDFSFIQVQPEFQDPKVEVLYHIRPHVVRIFPYIALKIWPDLW